MTIFTSKEPTDSMKTPRHHSLGMGRSRSVLGGAEEGEIHLAGGIQRASCRRRHG